MKLRPDRRSDPGAIAALLLALPMPAAAQLPDAEEVLGELGFSSADRQKVKGGVRNLQGTIAVD
jgi:hypothetical protein